MAGGTKRPKTDAGVEELGAERDHLPTIEERFIAKPFDPWELHRPSESDDPDE